MACSRAVIMFHGEKFPPVIFLLILGKVILIPHSVLPNSVNTIILIKKSGATD
jgi:hypothetical protein